MRVFCVSVNSLAPSRRLEQEALAVTDGPDSDARAQAAQSRVIHLGLDREGKSAGDKRCVPGIIR